MQKVMLFMVTRCGSQAMHSRSCLLLLHMFVPAGSMLKLHWYVYSMATPISYQLTLLNTTTPQGTAATVITPVSRTKQQQHQPAGTGSGDPAPAAGTARNSSSSSSDTDNKALAAEGAALSFSGAGFAHMEKNWGDAFPDQWVWAQGNTGDGKVSCSCSTV